MTEQAIFSVLAGLAGVLVTSLLVYLKGRRENQNKTVEIKSAIDARIDARVNQQLEASWADQDRMHTEVRDLRGMLGAQQRIQEDQAAELAEVKRMLASERHARRTLREVFVAYVERVQTGGTSQLTPGEKQALRDNEISDDDFPTVTGPAVPAQ